jgi:NAD(P)-dependent dehydrogenase (short-subunit alcohol dehydrogenase family)
MKLRNKVALVTGGGRGIGKAIAEAFAREGARVIITAARTRSEIEATAAAISATAVLADVSKQDEVVRLADSVTAKFGRIDILVNNAARGMRFVNEQFMREPRPFWEADPEAWRMVMDTNTTGVFLMTRAVVPGMIARRWGRIINISISLETMRRRGFSPYGPSKAALESMSDIWAQELEGSGVTLNLLLPGGATDTGMVPESFPEERRKALIDPDVMGPPAVYLASDEAGAVNGQRFVAKEWGGASPPAS